MKVRRTPWWYYLVALIIGLAGGVGLAMLDERMATSLLGAPWFVDVVLMAMGIAVLALALQVHAYANTDPAKRPHAFINPQRAMITLVLAKALGLAGAALAGWYGGQALMCLTHLEASYYRDAAVECAIALVICIMVGYILKPRFVIEEVETEGHRFQMKTAYPYLVKFVCPLFMAIILVMGLLSYFGVYSI